MPAIGPAAAVRKASLSSSTDVGRLTSAVKSTTLTVGVGTQAETVELALEVGMTSAGALPRPVVVGMMFWPALGRDGIAVRHVEDGSGRWCSCGSCSSGRARWSRSWTTLAAGARQLVVQLALLMM
jgi:hypothetical protein